MPLFHAASAAFHPFSGEKNGNKSHTGFMQTVDKAAIGNHPTAALSTV
jgi:hypothetical protein